MVSPRITVVVIDRNGVVQDTKRYQDPPQLAQVISEHLRASGFPGDLQNSTGDSLLPQHYLDHSQQYTLHLAPLERGRAPLLSTSGKPKVRKNLFLVIIDEHTAGGGFFWAPGKAVTANHNIPATYRKAEHSDHLTVRQLKGGSVHELVGALLTLCAFHPGLEKELADFKKGKSLSFGLIPAYGCSVSENQHHLMYDAGSWAVDSGTPLVLSEGEVVGMHVGAVNTLLEQLDRDQLIDQQMADVAESLAANNTAQLGVALLSHVFAN